MAGRQVLGNDARTDDRRAYPCFGGGANEPESRWLCTWETAMGGLSRLKPCDVTMDADTLLRFVVLVEVDPSVGFAGQVE